MTMDRAKESLAQFIRTVMHGTEFHALYPATVHAQNADGTLELTPDDVNVPPMSSVPLRLGMPGLTVKVAAPSRVLVGFENGDAQHYIATLWEKSTVLEIHFDPTLVLELGSGAVDAAVKGTTYRAAEDTLLSAIEATITSLGATVAAMAATAPMVAAPAVVTAAAASVTALAAMVSAQAAFAAAAPGFLSTLVKVK